MGHENMATTNIYKTYHTRVYKLDSYIWNRNGLTMSTLSLKLFTVNHNVTSIIISNHHSLLIFYFAFTIVVIPTSLGMWIWWWCCCLIGKFIFVFVPCLFLTAAIVLYIESSSYNLEHNWKLFIVKPILHSRSWNENGYILLAKTRILVPKQYLRFLSFLK